MGELIDAHIHTERCGHATGSVRDYVAAAVERGLTAMVITDHLPLPDDLDPDRHLSMPACDVEPYLDEIVAAREEFPQIEIVTGIEADYLPNRIAETKLDLRRLRSLHNGVQVVLGSVHFLGEWAFDSPHEMEEWNRRDIDDVWREYFDHWCAAARSKLFDVMAHPDLVKKFGHRPSFDARELYAEAAKAAADGNVMIEVSTAGLRKPVGEIYPGLDLLKAFKKAGVEATVSSDAHEPEEVGYQIEAAYQLMRDAGYKWVLLPTNKYETKVFPL